MADKKRKRLSKTVPDAVIDEANGGAFLMSGTYTKEQLQRLLEEMPDDQDPHEPLTEEEWKRRIAEEYRL